MAERLAGKVVSDEIIAKAKAECLELKKSGINPKLAVIRVGNDLSNISYEKSIMKLMAKAEIEVQSIVLESCISEKDFESELNKVNYDDSVHGILVFRPLPRQLDEDEIKYIISPQKDIDCFSPVNLAKVFMSDDSGFSPCTPLGVMRTLEYYDIDLHGKEVVIVGRSLVVGKPLSMMLLDKHATVTICHSRTEDLPSVCKKADVLILAIGRAEMIDDTFIKEGAAVMDVGINFKDGKLCGDVDYEKAERVAGKITPVPGGLGGVTTACLVENLIKACKLQTK